MGKLEHTGKGEFAKSWWCLYPVHVRKWEEGTPALLFLNCLKFPHAGPKTTQIQGNSLCERLGRRNWGRRARELGCLRSV